MNKPIFIDMDDVICDFITELCDRLHKKYNKKVTPSQITTWTLSDHIGNDWLEIIQEPGYFKSLKPIDGAIDTINKLIEENREVFIITSPMNEYSVFEKYLWVKEYLPFFPINNLILVGNKGDILSKINNGILFDDCPEYLEKFNGITVTMDKPYNWNVKSDFRVSNWDDFYRVVREEMESGVGIGMRLEKGCCERD